MALDLAALSPQIRQMGNSLAQNVNEKYARLNEVSERYLSETGKEDVWGQIIDQAVKSRKPFPWPLAKPLEPFDTVEDALPSPTEHVILATDGSQIDVNHHGNALCYLINIGKVYLHYGPNSRAKLSSHPMLAYEEEDLYLQKEGMQRILVEGRYVNFKRDVQEIKVLTDLATEWADLNVPTLALQDGTLIRWVLASEESIIKERFLEPYRQSLAYFCQKQLPIASYISRSRAREIMGMLRFIYCHDVQVGQEPRCQRRKCSPSGTQSNPSCFICEGLTDGQLLGKQLQKDGQRGPLFISLSPINVRDYEERQRIHFFYMRIGREIARIEVPQWVAKDSKHISLVQSLIFDQCKKGQGYPVALARAHEQAVVRSADRRTFEKMIEGSLLRAEVPNFASRKLESKEQITL